MLGFCGIHWRVALNHGKSIYVSKNTVYGASKHQTQKEFKFRGAYNVGNRVTKAEHGGLEGWDVCGWIESANGWI